ncbi:MAG TPA: hypothetical protein VE891_08385, partial [Allosphingosinicella sp.]|nr:hypothetical protein [Allosphingosinicella sp.]
MATYTNPRGSVTGTADSDTFIFDTPLDNNALVDGKEAADTIVVNRSSDRRTHFIVGEQVDNGGLQGGVYYGDFYIPVTDRYISFSNIESVQFTGSGSDDRFDLTINSGSPAFQVAFDGGDGQDSLSFNFTGGGLSFVVDDETITSSFGTFASIESFAIRTGAGNDVVRTGAGVDFVSTGSGSDEIFTGSGRDVISTEGGGDSIDGGVGYDSWTGDFSASAESLTFNLGSTITSSNGTAALNIESVRIIAGSGDDQFNVTRLGT